MKNEDMQIIKKMIKYCDDYWYTYGKIQYRF